MAEHVHQFEAHVGIPVFGRRRMAWVPFSFTSRPPAGFESQSDAPVMWRCVDCGEQGYSVPA